MTKVMIVDDSKVDQMIIEGMLCDYSTVIMNNGKEALDYLETYNDIDIMILDLNMPEIDGFQLLEQMNQHEMSFDFPVIILTNYEEVTNELRGLALGAVDYIRKPLNAGSLLKRLEVHIHLLDAKATIKKHNSFLEDTVEERTKQLLASRDITINALVGLLEVRDFESSNHTKRTMHMMRILCEHLSRKARYAEILNQKKIDTLAMTAPLHDIGKVGVPDHILLKPGPLTPEEYEIMKSHVKYGVDAITTEQHDEQVDMFLKTALNIISSHHERFDGQGYPMGLKGKAIPLEGRLMAIIDVYDALSSERVYKEAYDHNLSLEMIKKEKGKHFDPDIVDAFLEVEEKIANIAADYGSNRGDS